MAIEVEQLLRLGLQKKISCLLSLPCSLLAAGIVQVFTGSFIQPLVAVKILLLLGIGVQLLNSLTHLLTERGILLSGI